MAITPSGAEKVALLALLYQQEPRPDRRMIRDRMMQGENPSAILNGSYSALFGSGAEEACERAAQELAGWEAQGIRLLTPLDDYYPGQLFGVWDHPLALFARGAVQHDYRSAAIVGSRGFSVGGQAFARELAAMLTGSGVTVVSGLARGIDGTAHRAALTAGGRTVAVLGNGLDRVYPAEHRGMQEEIAASGLLVSQFRPDTRSSQQSFPQRNVTMSAYSSVTVIAEAQEKSGTRIQARAAIGHGRPLVISRQVQERTTWGRDYSAGGYDVQVADIAEDAAAMVLGILARAERPLQLSAI